MTRWGAVRRHAPRVAVALALAGLTYALFPASPAVDFPLLEVGSVAPTNVIAPFAFDVAKVGAELAAERDVAAATVLPVLAQSPAALDTSRSQLAELMRRIDQVAAQATGAADQVAVVQQAAASVGVPLAPAEAAYLVSPLRRRAMATAVARAFDRWGAAGVAEPRALDGARGRVAVRRDGVERTTDADSVLTFPTMLVRARALNPEPESPVAEAVFVRLLTATFHPTLVPDPVLTERRRQEARASVDEAKYHVRAGEKIVGAHEVVGRTEYEKMRSLRAELQQRVGAERGAGRVVGAVLFNALVVAIFGLTLLLFRPALYDSVKTLLVFAAGFAIVIGVSGILSHVEPIYPELIPVALAAVLFSVLFDPRIALIAAMVLAVLIGGQSVFRGTNALFVNLIGGVAGAFSVRVISRRNQALLPTLTIAAAYLVAAAAIGLTLDLPLQEIGRSAARGAVNAVASVALAMLLIPAAEEFAGVVTYFRLLEWSDLNRPLMQRLSLEAPGTYAHTIAIANLAEAAANAIGASGLLARVGAYYHDVGKLKKPQFFVENQAKGRNPHDKLKPQTSASIIRNHVQAGLELAEEYKLPRPIRAFITEHHGTGQISYFLERARERDGGVGNPNEYIYPGPLPQSAETAVVMLADGVEAAARVLNDPTPQKIREVVEHIVRQRIDQGQLREAPLTLRQLETVKDQFARVLLGMYHTRIDYPAASGGITSEFASV
ncbi:MAG: HD family phosphohydrolase [Gemmatimonadaceae bacterium]